MTDDRIDPERSPGHGTSVEDLADVDVGRDVTLGEATPRELAASDTAPLADASTDRIRADLAGGDPVERRRAALALADAGGSPAVLAGLARAALDDDDAEVRQFAVEALAQVGGPTAAEVAVAVAEDDDPWVRAEAVVALDRLDRSRHAERFREALDDDHHAVRRNAAVSLFKLRGADAADRLVALAADPSERVREWAAHLLAGVDDDRATAVLRALAGDEQEAPVVRTTAARSLAADPAAFRRQFAGSASDGPGATSTASSWDRPPEL